MAKTKSKSSESIKSLKNKIKILEEALVEKDKKIEELVEKNQLLAKVSLKIEDRNIELQGIINDLKKEIEKLKKQD